MTETRLGIYERSVIRLVVSVVEKVKERVLSERT